MLINNNSEEDTVRFESHTEPVDPYVEMVSDAFGSTESEFDQMREEDPNFEAKKFYDILDAAKQPIYDGCKEGLSKLSLAARLMSLKTDNNLSQNCMDSIAQIMQEYLPEGNNSPKSYYEIKKLMRSLGLPYQKIDVCQDNCMIFWKETEKEEYCLFCKKDRYRPTQKIGQKSIPYRQMFYLPIADRLKRLYQSHNTAKHMRWHAEHLASDGEMGHPSDGEAWKHFHKVHPDFASKPRNVYLGLCTDGFNPFGMSGHNYSLWPVILTPYNLPPEMCMKQEFMFLTILVPGPNHPKRSLDIFLQPLIEELKDLWVNGVEAYDISTKQNFLLKVVLMWTISDFPAYGMLSGWTTHGRLACPYCSDQTGAFWLKNGRKTCWFDCHRCFLPVNHSYRGNKKDFKKGKVVEDSKPEILTGEELYNEVCCLPKTVDCGGNHGRLEGYGKTHNWHKQSILWELSYWKDLKLRHNLDVMHIEKNVLDNFIKTLLNVQGKTKDNIKSRLDLQEHCNRKDLHLTPEGKAPIPKFRLKPDAKEIFLRWLEKDVKFSDGYSSSLANCVDLPGRKLTGMKSHDCHVLMQRLFPIAFVELMDKSVHDALSRRGSGKESEIWLQDKDYHIAHRYILRNCDQLRPFERLFDESLIAANPGISEKDLNELREKQYSSWLKKYVEDTWKDNSYPEWLLSIVHGPMVKVTCWPMYFCRGYIFHTYDHGKNKKNANYGVCVKGTTSSSSNEEADFYGILREIYELHYPGHVDLKVVVFKCDWYDSKVGRGIRRNKSGIIDINAKRHYEEYDPFVLASQADQVCYVPYPRMTQPRKDQQWEAAIMIQPRGKVLINKNLDFTAMQHDNDDSIVEVDSLQIETLSYLDAQPEDLDDPVVEAEDGSDAEDGNSDIELTSDESE
ncbi:hypothetical protein ISN44_Un30g000040 [Arabidopsis suecica]|uniref:DUF4216 domain-containing protein n=1 Tax=Arabidopsis suecica TaxID=45249 RepID=A0A8T1XKX2_ARASU|nr:hypothetical protein ISN44_Un30g000040 [Arabidopsis suecica]